MAAVKTNGNLNWTLHLFKRRLVSHPRQNVPPLNCQVRLNVPPQSRALLSSFDLERSERSKEDNSSLMGSTTWTTELMVRISKGWPTGI